LPLLGYRRAFSVGSKWSHVGEFKDLAPGPAPTPRGRFEPQAVSPHLARPRACCVARRQDRYGSPDGSCERPAALLHAAAYWPTPAGYLRPGCCRSRLRAVSPTQRSLQCAPWPIRWDRRCEAPFSFCHVSVGIVLRPPPALGTVTRNCRERTGSRVPTAGSDLPWERCGSIAGLETFCLPAPAVGWQISIPTTHVNGLPG
jgi:hypothetical protein